MHYILTTKNITFSQEQTKLLNKYIKRIDLYQNSLIHFLRIRIYSQTKKPYYKSKIIYILGEKKFTIDASAQTLTHLIHMMFDKLLRSISMLKEKKTNYHKQAATFLNQANVL